MMSTSSPVSSAMLVRQRRPSESRCSCKITRIAAGYLPLALDVRRPGLQPTDVRLLQLQLGGVLDGDQALLLRDEGGERVEHRGLAGAGAAGNDQGDARL